MIRLFRKDETDFNHNEWVLDQTTKCLITEEINGSFELDFEYTIEDYKNLSPYLIRGNIISCHSGDNRPDQLFRIRKVSKDSSTKRVTIYARAIAIADLESNYVPGTEIVGKTRREGIKQILDNTLEETKFYVGTLDNNNNSDIDLGIDDDTGEIRNILSIDGVSPLEGIVGTEDSILSAYGGEVIYNNFELNIVDKRGEDNGVLISYGKNITGITEDIDDMDLVTAVIMESSDNVYLPENEYVIQSPRSGQYEKIFFKHIKLDDVSLVDDSEEAMEIVYEQLREGAKHLFEVDKVDVPSFNYTVNFIQLAKTEEYRDYAILETTHLGDTVIVRHEKMNIDLEGRVIKRKYNVLTDKLEEVEIGFKKKDIVDIINETNRQIRFTKQNILLRVSNLQNDIYSQIEMTEEKIRAEVGNVKEGLESSITQTAKDIRLEVKNTKEDIQSSITQTASDIRSEVKNVKEGLETSITQTAKDIRLEVKDKVDEDDFGSLIEQNSRSISLAIKGETNMNVLFNSRGQTIKNGALEIEDNRGNTIMSFDDGLVVCDAIGVDDLVIHDTSKGSDFYNCLANMDELYTNKLSCERLYIEGKHIADYIRRQIDDYLG